MIWELERPYDSRSKFDGLPPLLWRCLDVRDGSLFAVEVTEHLRSLLLEAIGSGQPEGTRYFTFNAFNVLLDYDRGLATVEDDLNAGTICRIEMVEFAQRLRTPSSGSD
jgi:hypothetical protein